MSKTPPLSRNARNSRDGTNTRSICPACGYLKAIKLLLKDNQLYRGTFSALGRKIGIGDIICPTFLMADESDDITPYPQVFAAEAKLGIPKEKIAKKLVPGGHIGLFMGSKTLKSFWPEFPSRIKRECAGA